MTDAESDTDCIMYACFQALGHFVFELYVIVSPVHVREHVHTANAAISVPLYAFLTDMLKRLC